MTRIKQLSRWAGTLCLTLAAFTAHAAMVNLHQDPAATSPVIATVDTAKGIMPIYTPKGSEWVKIADPTNGNVGWVKQSDLINANTASVMVKQETVAPSGKANGYTIQMGKPIDVTSHAAKENLDDMQKMQQNIQKNIQDMVTGMDKLYQKQMQFLKDNGFYAPSTTTKAPVTSATPAPKSDSTTQ